VAPEIGTGIPGGTATLEAGWIDQSSVPGKNQLNNFVVGNSVNFGGYVPLLFDETVGLAAAEIYGNVGDSGSSAFGTQVGIGIGEGRNLSLQWSYGFHVSDSGPTWQ
jgi:hypothetical protein